MARAFTAKAFVSAVSKTAIGQTQLTFTADYADGANKEWSQYTPSLSVNMSVLDEIAADLKFGDRFTITFQQED